MSAVEELEAAIAKLTAIRCDAGSVTQGHDREAVFFRTDYDIDNDGKVFTYGLGIDLGEEELVNGIVTLHRTIDAQLELLQEGLTIARYLVSPEEDAEIVNFIALARAINGTT